VTLLSGLLATLAIGDLLRPSDARPTKQQRTRSWFAALTAVVAFSWGLGIEPLVALAGAAVVAIWLLFTPGPRRSPWALAALGVVLVLVAFVFDPMMPATSGPFQNWFERAAPAMLEGVDFSAFAMALACFLFLLNSANFVVRLVVDLTGVEETDDTVPLKGGRFLGPIERVLILALGLAGQFGAIAAVVGAKSIIRYPEISKSDDGGKTAEYFLIGSGLSWGIALLALAGTVGGR
jgi:hypothetical protein